NHTTNKIDVILAARMFRQIVSLPLRYFEVRRVGDILMRIAGLNSIREFFTGSSISVLLDTVFSLLFIAVMSFYSWSLTLLALLAMPLYLGQNILA
ncbi:MAG: type I secretion system permease/ATPase, partial [Deltaproteobacteria bacterium]|nr:type I secretion system permease/ATPase [Deltaproteobacteria bacterium]